MGIKVTGNSRIDTATAEIAGHIRDGRIGSHVSWREQEHYDEATRLRDEIMLGTREQAGYTLPAWRAAVNGTSKRPWFLIRGWGTESDSVPLAERYLYDVSGQLVRFASNETAQRAADRMNEVAK